MDKWEPFVISKLKPFTPCHFVIRDGDGIPVAQTWLARDARLVATAPELLEVLEWAVEAADANQYEACWYAAARSAISKAKGNYNG